jgi:hypothetical protein
MPSLIVMAMFRSVMAMLRSFFNQMNTVTPVNSIGRSNKNMNSAGSGS